MFCSNFLNTLKITVYMQIKNSFSQVSIRGPVQAHCNGIIVNDRHVLTSAQCVLNVTSPINPFFFSVISGDLNMIVPTYRRFTTNVTHIYTHVNYVPNSLINDIAVIRVCAILQLNIEILVNVKNNLYRLETRSHSHITPLMWPSELLE